MSRVAIAVMRCQPFHKGHASVLNSMLLDYEKVILGIGSTGRSREPQNPWTIVERQDMVKNVYGNRVKIVPLEDIGAEQGANTWCDYVLDKIQLLGMPEPTDYFTGSRMDGLWYQGRFYNPTYHSAPLESHYSDDRLCRLHILDREVLKISATEVRGYLRMRDHSWKPLVPAVNHQLIEDTFPQEFTISVS